MGSATKRRVTMGRWGSLRCAGSDPVLLTVSSSSSVGIEALELAPLSESQVGVGVWSQVGVGPAGAQGPGARLGPVKGEFLHVFLVLAGANRRTKKKSGPTRQSPDVVYLLYPLQARDASEGFPCGLIGERITSST